MPIPEFYANMLGITEWQAGMPVYYQKLPEEVSELPKEKTEEIETFVQQLSNVLVHKYLLLEKYLKYC